MFKYMKMYKILKIKIQKTDKINNELYNQQNKNNLNQLLIFIYY